MQTKSVCDLKISLTVIEKKLHHRAVKQVS